MEEYLIAASGSNPGFVGSGSEYIRSSISDDQLKPKTYKLEQNFPNPFNPITVINYQLPVDGLVTLKVFNILGQEIVTLVDEVQEAGYKSVNYDAANLPSGVYFYRFQANPVDGRQGGSYTTVKKMILVR
ncbi:MAG: T9SS type A sorting domain-containing protein [Ignavibacteriales bacterium]|nr:T9SS type A sorting domain-containing protein [Ignavibacteriales bacterium]